MIILKRVIALLVLTFSVLCCAFTVNAQQTGKLTLSVDEEVEPGKSFELRVNYHASECIGAFYGYLQYDTNSLKLTKLSKEDKLDTDVFKYEDTDGVVRIIYMTKTDDSEDVDFILRFSPKNKDITEYRFASEVYEVYSVDEKKLSSDRQEFNVSIKKSDKTKNTDNKKIKEESQNKKITVKSDADDEKSDSDDSGKTQNKASDAEVSVKIPKRSDKYDNSSGKGSLSENNSYVDTSDKDNDNDNDNDNVEEVYVLKSENDGLKSSMPWLAGVVGAGGALAVIIILTYSVLRKIKNKK